MSAEETGLLLHDDLVQRLEHPCDDIMTDLLRAEFEDETGTRRKPTREEILLYVNVITGAGLEEILKRFPRWEVDQDNAESNPMAAVRGWDSLPVRTP